jgi:predicted ribosomally synthesized peptide with nif11-like leader
MSADQLEALLARVKLDTRLQQELRAADDLQAALSVAAHAGFSVTMEELQTLQQPPTVELSDEELEGVTGGAGRNDPSQWDMWAERYVCW